MPYKDRLSKNKNYKEWYAVPENKERARQQRAKANAKCREEIFNLLGCVCRKCGHTDTRVLQVDHVNGGGCAERREMGHNRYGLLKRVREAPDKYQILCANCNWLKRITNDEQTHHLPKSGHIASEDHVQRGT